MVDSAAGSRGEAARIGIVTVSDRASRGEYEDRGGPAVQAYLTEVLATAWEAVARIIPDEEKLIRATLVDLVDEAGCCLVITTGGTGPAPRDVTPEATAAVLDRELAGFGEAMRAVSRPHVPTAILSRQMAGGARGRADHQSAGLAQGRPRVSGRRVRGRSRLRGPDRGAVPGDGPVPGGGASSPWILISSM